MLVLVVIQAVADPTGLLALVGWSGALPQLDAGSGRSPRTWSIVPVLLGVVWWATVRAGDRFWTLAAGVVLAVLLAQAAACLVMTWDLGDRRVGGRLRDREGRAGRAHRRRVHPLVRRQAVDASDARAPASIWLPAALFAARRAAASPACGGPAPSTHPASRPRAPIAASCPSSSRCCSSPAPPRCACAGCARACPACSAAGSPRSSRAASSGIVQAIVAFVVDGGSSGDIWPLMAAYIAVADGLSFGACVGWVVGVSAVVADRVRVGRAARACCSSPPAVVAVARGGRHARRARVDAAPPPRQPTRAVPPGSSAPTATSSPTATATRCCCAA